MTMDKDRLPFVLDRTVTIHARPDRVFGYFEDNARWAAWFGEGSTIEPRAGGKVGIRFPGGVEVSGEVVGIAPPSKIVFTYGFNCGTPIGPGQSVVTVHVEAFGRGTLVRLSHAFANETARNEHAQGWRFQLSLLGNLVSNDLHGDVAAIADALFAAWAEPDDMARRAALSAIAAPDITFGDRYSMLSGIDDLVHHAGAARRFMPGMRLERSGDVRQCLGTALVDWCVKGSDGGIKGTGTNVLRLNQDGKIEAVTGLWN